MTQKNRMVGSRLAIIHLPKCQPGREPTQGPVFLLVVVLHQYFACRTRIMFARPISVSCESAPLDFSPPLGIAVDQSQQLAYLPSEERRLDSLVRIAVFTQSIQVCFAR
jgi:hypothetical protein